MSVEKKKNTISAPNHFQRRFQMRYYIVTAKCGHVGKGWFIPIDFAIKGQCRESSIIKRMRYSPWKKSITMIMKFAAMSTTMIHICSAKAKRTKCKSSIRLSAGSAKNAATSLGSRKNARQSRCTMVRNGSETSDSTQENKHLYMRCWKQCEFYGGKKDVWY